MRSRPSAKPVSEPSRTDDAMARDEDADRVASFSRTRSTVAGRTQRALPNDEGGLRADPGEHPLRPKYRSLAASLVRSWRQPWAGMVAVSMTKR